MSDADYIKTIEADNEALRNKVAALQEENLDLFRRLQAQYDRENSDSHTKYGDYDVEFDSPKMNYSGTTPMPTTPVDSTIYKDLWAAARKADD